VSGPIEDLRAAVVAAASQIGEPSSEPTLERPRQAGYGDFSTNAAMLLAKSAGAPPREIAERLAGILSERLG
jgi:arginyl-tRNA synthetase